MIGTALISPRPRRASSACSVSAPFRGKAAGTLGFVVSRARITDGRFDGVAAVTLSPDYFRDFYQSVLHWHETTSAALLRDDGTVLVRYPANSRLAFVISRSAPIMRALAKHFDNGVEEGIAVADGRAKIFGYRRLPDTNLVAVYTLDRGGVLGEWYQHLAIFAAFALLTMFALLYTARRAVREAERQQTCPSALQQAGELEALGRLTGGLAHDFNNLLAIIIGNLDMLREIRAGDQVTDELVRDALKSALRGADLTRRLLAFARRQPLQPERADINEVIGAIVRLLARTLGENITIEMSLTPNVWPCRSIGRSSRR